MPNFTLPLGPAALGDGPDKFDLARTTVSQLSQASEDLLNLGQVLENRAHAITWECAKARRYRDAVSGRRAEARRIAAGIQNVAAGMSILILLREIVEQLAEEGA